MLIGSRAIAYWNPEFKIGSDSDWDIIGTPESEDFFRSRFYIPDSERIEWHDPNHLNNKSVDSYGGEDQGSDFYSVILIRNPDNHDEQYYIKFQGWYASYNGVEYDNWSFVEPKQKTVTVYS